MHTIDESRIIDDDRTNDDIFQTEISEEVYLQNYRYGQDSRVPDSWYRNARALAQEEENVEGWTRKFYELLSGKGIGTGPFPFTPGGRIFANAGTGLGKASLINCFVAGARGEDQDSMDEIQAELTRQAKILASEGGYGFCASFMRPRGARIGGVGSMTPGAVRMLDCWNEQAATIVAGSGMDSDRDDVKDKIRKGAQMVTMHCWHPDLIEFIEAKQESGRLHKFNMSVLVTGDFMEAVRNDDTWALRFPAYEEEPDFYEKHWSGNLEEYEAKGGTVKTWRDPATGEKAEYRARDIWDKIMRSTYERNEPGVLFVDKMNKENNLGYEEHIDATNPCFTGDTLISTDQGLISAVVLAEANSPQEVVVDGRLSDQKLRPTTEQGVYKTGEKMTYDVVTEEGYELSVTADHKIRTPSGWVETQGLSEGDEIHIQNRKGGFGNRGSLGEGRVLGWLVGDGYVNEEMSWGVLSFFGEDCQIAEAMAEATNELPRHSDHAHRDNYESGVVEITDDASARSDQREVRVQNKPTYELAVSTGLAENKLQVPDRVMRGSEDMSRGYLQGLFSADGGVQGTAANGSSVRLSSVKKDFLKDVQRLLLNFNIYSTLYTDRKPEGKKMLPDGQGGSKEYDVQGFHDLVVSKDDLIRFRDEIGFLIDYKSEQLDELLDSYTKGPYSRTFTATVDEIRDRGVEPVYDLTEPNTHSLVGNGIVIHNCGEQILPPGGVCLLGNFNTTQLLKEDHSGFDYDLLAELVPRAVRFLDNVNDRTYVPTEKQRWNLQNKRRIGLGHFGDGSALTMMKVRYGSEEGVRVMREFQRNLANMAYQASAQLAKEKGAFPLFDKDEYLNNSPFIARLSDKTKAMIAEHGLRNSHLLSIQPTGNTSTLANAPSSGVEPVFMHSYVRTAEQPALPEGIQPPMKTDRVLEDGDVIGSNTGPNPTMWRAEEQGDEIVLRCEEDGYTHWQMHPTRGIVKDQTVEDYARRTMNGDFDPEADWTVTTRDLDVDDHLAQMKALAPFIDSSMSKTVNVPNDYPFEDFKGLYEKAYDATAVKGVTTYRSGTMSAVLSGEDDGEEDIPRTEAPERPDTLDCAIHRVRFRGDNWKILVGFYEGTPYEVFAFTTFGEVRIVDSEGTKLTEGRIRKAGSGQYELLAPEGDDKVIVEDIASKAPNDNVKHETRLVSTSLRHGAKIDFLVSQLKKAEGSIASFGTSLAKALQAHAETITPTCDRCGSENVRFEEACLQCADCGHSKCS